MTIFDDREKSFEKKMAMEEEMAFKTHARAVKLLGLWAAAKIGKSDADADAYAKSVIVADFEAPGDQDFIGKLLRDFAAAELAISEKEIRTQLAACREEAVRQLKSEMK